MKKTILLSIVLLLTGFLVNAQTKYKADKSNSQITWLGKKITGEHNGSISLLSGELSLNKDVITKAVFEIDMTSIKNIDITDEEYRAKLEGHLKSEDFFGVDKFPKATFVIDKAIKIQKGNTFVNGKITIKGITLPIMFKAVITETPEGLRIYANIVIDRTKFNVRYGSGSFFDNLGDKTIYDDFNISLNLLMKK